MCVAASQRHQSPSRDCLIAWPSGARSTVCSTTCARGSTRRTAATRFRSRRTTSTRGWPHSSSASRPSCRCRAAVVSQSCRVASRSRRVAVVSLSCRPPPRPRRRASRFCWSFGGCRPPPPGNNTVSMPQLPQWLDERDASLTRCGVLVSRRVASLSRRFSRVASWRSRRGTSAARAPSPPAPLASHARAHPIAARCAKPYETKPNTKRNETKRNVGTARIRRAISFRRLTSPNSASTAAACATSPSRPSRLCSTRGPSTRSMRPKRSAFERDRWLLSPKPRDRD